MTNPLPYTISDILLNHERSEFLRKRNIKISQVLESKADEFYQYFGIHLVFFVDQLTGFDYCRFTNAVLKPVLNGTSDHDAIVSRYGIRAAELIGELIFAGCDRT
jgi:hypothetical protein